MNSRWCEGAFPLGTFLANFTGSLALGLLYYVPPDDVRQGWSGIVVRGFEGGFLGCLTTMSSFVAEVVGHRDKHGAKSSYTYLGSTAVSSLAAVLIVGAALDG